MKDGFSSGRLGDRTADWIYRQTCRQIEKAVAKNQVSDDKVVVELKRGLLNPQPTMKAAELVNALLLKDGWELDADSGSFANLSSQRSRSYVVIAKRESVEEGLSSGEKASRIPGLPVFRKRPLAATVCGSPRDCGFAHFIAARPFPEGLAAKQIEQFRQDVEALKSTLSADTPPCASVLEERVKRLWPSMQALQGALKAFADEQAALDLEKLGLKKSVGSLGVVDFDPPGTPSATIEWYKECPSRRWEGARLVLGEYLNQCDQRVERMLTHGFDTTHGSEYVHQEPDGRSAWAWGAGGYTG